jgi:hypothetical protein
MTEIAEIKYPNTLDFFRAEMAASSCIDEKTRERVYQCMTKHAIETLGDGNDCGEVESFLSQEGFPFTMARYEIGNVMIDGDYNIAADYVRHLIDCFRKDGVGKNYSTLDEGPVSHGLLEEIGLVSLLMTRSLFFSSMVRIQTNSLVTLRTLVTV